MNWRYFACTDCKIFTDAGYRWCYWELEHPGVVRLGDSVNIERVLRQERYWSPPKEPDSDWLYRHVFPPVREFFARHGGHCVVYWEDNNLPEDVFLEWLRTGPLPYPAPRYFIEVLGFTRWEEVLAWEEAQVPRDSPRNWLNSDEDWRRYRRAFERHAARRARGLE